MPGHTNLGLLLSLISIKVNYYTPPFPWFPKLSFSERISFIPKTCESKPKATFPHTHTPLGLGYTASDQATLVRFLAQSPSYGRRAPDRYKSRTPITLTIPHGPVFPNCLSLFSFCLEATYELTALSRNPAVHINRGTFSQAVHLTRYYILLQLTTNETLGSLKCSNLILLPD